ncbi:L-threonylcarbamoyladenylate synthase [Flavobacteriaceae bacterium]|nr:L-threonylcarbamoyladenylate synthase [Flavobacteriaceae bacterium]
MDKLRTFYSKTPNSKYLQEAANLLHEGGMIIFPTDTVYALGCLSTQGERLRDLAKIKGMKLEQAPLSFIFDDIRSLSHFVVPMKSQIFKLVKRLLPGPYTLIMQAAHKLPKPFQKRRTIGVRISNHPLLKALLPLLNAPLVCTSIHDPDEILDYTTDPETLLELWDKSIDLMLSDGYGSNIPSTVIDLTETPFKILRQGAGENPF